jgi:WD40 repeat protein
MIDSIQKLLFLIIFTFVALVGCTSSMETQHPTQEPISVTPDQTGTPLLYPSPTSTLILRPSSTPTDTPLLNPTPVPTPTYNLNIQDTFAGDPLPANLAVISPDNLPDLQLLAYWGKGTVEAVVHSPDGELIAVASSRGAFLYDALTLDEVLFIPTQDWTYDVAFSPDGKSLALQTACGTQVHSVEDGYPIWSRDSEECWPEGSVAFSPDGRLLASGLHSNVYLRNAVDGKLTNHFQTTPWMNPRYNSEEPTTVLDLQFSPDGSNLAVSQSAPAVNCFDVTSGENFANLFEMGVQVNVYEGPDTQAVAFTPDGSYLVAIDQFSDNLSFFEVPSMEFSHALDIEAMDDALSIAIAPSGDHIAIGKAPWRGEGQYVVQIHDLEDGTLLQTLSGPDGPVTTLSFSPDGERLAAGSIDNTLHLWQLSDGKVVGALQSHTDEITDMDFSPDGSLLAVAMMDRKARVWRIPDGTLLYRVGANADFGFAYDNYVPGMFTLNFSSDGSVLATGSDNAESLRFWLSIDGEPLSQIYSRQVFDLHFVCGDDALLIEYGTIGRVTEREFDLLRIADQTHVEPSVSLWGGGEVSVSSAGNLVAASIIDPYADPITCMVDIWDISYIEITNRRTLFEEEWCPDQMTFSPDEKYLTIINQWSDPPELIPFLRLIRVSDGSIMEALLRSSASDEQPVDLEFSPDGQILALVMNDGQVKFWGIPELSPISTHQRIIAGHVQKVFYGAKSNIIRFSPDGRLLAIALANGSVALWGVVQ